MERPYCAQINLKHRHQFLATVGHLNTFFRQGDGNLKDQIFKS